MKKKGEDKVKKQIKTAVKQPLRPIFEVIS